MPEQTKVTKEQLDAWEEMASKATPEPWAWEGYESTRSLMLMAWTKGHPVVMDFARWGMESAQPVFRDQSNILVKAKELLQTQGVSGRITGINHPDAVFIAAARAAVPALITAFRAEKAQSEHFGNGLIAAVIQLRTIEHAITDPQKPETDRNIDAVMALQELILSIEQVLAYGPETADAAPVEGYYLLDCKGGGGDMMSWWRGNGAGYTYYLEFAGIYSAEDIKRRGLVHNIELGQIMALPVAAVRAEKRSVLPWETREGFNAESLFAEYRKVVPLVPVREVAEEVRDA